MNKNKGLSLIVLVITIIVIIILAGTVILSLVNNNPISQANAATFKANVSEYNSELAITVSGKYLQNNLFNPSTFNAGTWDGVSSTTGTVKEYITSMTTKDAAKFEIQSSKLVYVGTDEIEENWLAEMEIISGEPTPPVVTELGVNVIATENTTVNGEAATYNNPIIPKGFKAINDGAIWPTDWNEGLVIEDVSGNQFVWVPVDGTNVQYTKWCITGIAYNNTNISDDSLPSGFNVNNITTYKGFYIARYESMFDYNLGNIRVASKKSANKKASDWSTTRNATYNGYLWNYVSYTDAKLYSQSMATNYGYDTTHVGTNLITGAEWDTTMKWIQNSGISVTDSRTWGNYSNAISPANVSGYANLQVSGYSNYWKSKNIYDLAGNTFEWTNEKYSADFVSRGGNYFAYEGLTYPAACRKNSQESYSYYGLTFRVALYIK